MDTIWDNMSVPRDEHAKQRDICKFTVPCHVWRKIAGKHMADLREPWDDEWLEPSDVKTLREWGGKAMRDEDAHCIESVSKKLQEHVSESLAQPLIIEYFYGRLPLREAKKQEGRSQPLAINPQRSLRLVLPSGARLEARTGKDGWSVRTCYFDVDIADRSTPRWQRYRNLANKLRRYYLIAPTVSGTPPRARHRVDKEDSCEWGFVFVTPAKWGLDGSPAPGAPGNLLGPMWPEAPVPPGKWLRPPFRAEEDTP